MKTCQRHTVKRLKSILPNKKYGIILHYNLHILYLGLKYISESLLKSSNNYLWRVQLGMGEEDERIYSYTFLYCLAFFKKSQTGYCYNVASACPLAHAPRVPWPWPVGVFAPQPLCLRAEAGSRPHALGTSLVPSLATCCWTSSDKS